MTHSFYRSTKERTRITSTTFDYCFRYDTDAHWLTRTAPPLEWKLGSAILFGRYMLGSTNLIKWSGRLEPMMKWKKRPEVVADVFIPARRFLDFGKRYEEEMSFYPLWIVPYRVPRQYPWLSRDHFERMGDDLFIDCAVYGMKNNGETDASPRLEELTFDLDGIKALIGRNHYSDGTVLGHLQPPQLQLGEDGSRPERGLPRPLLQAGQHRLTTFRCRYRAYGARILTQNPRGWRTELA